MSALAPGKKIYFISDFHLGIPDREKSLEREKKIVRWLDSIRHDAQVLFLMGDVFDYWFEYSEAVPKGYVRLLGKLAELSDSGIELHYFTGNHDMWVFDYFTQEMGIQIHRDTIVKEYNGKSFFLGHGDGLGPSDHGYKLIKSVFANPACQWLFARIHPNTGIRIMKFSPEKVVWPRAVMTASLRERKTNGLYSFVKTSWPGSTSIFSSSDTGICPSISH